MECSLLVAKVVAANALNPVAFASSPLSGIDIPDICPIDKKLIDMQILCDVVCCCKDTPLPDTCEKSVFTTADRILGGKSRYKSQVAYDMTKTPPSPIMSTTNPRQPSQNWMYAPKNYVEGFKPGQGHVRIPDVTILKDGSQPVSPKNISTIAELKINKDKYNPGQKEAYQRIAEGSNSKLETVGNNPASGELTKCCPCQQKKKQPQLKPQPYGVPVPVVPEFKIDWKLVGEGATVAGLAVLTGIAIACPFDGPVLDCVAGGALATQSAAFWGRLAVVGL